jgi:hypothetical protein
VWQGDVNSAYDYCTQFKIEDIKGLPTPSPLLGLCENPRRVFLLNDDDEDVCNGYTDRIVNMLCGNWSSLCDLRVCLSDDIVTFSPFYGKCNFVAVLTSLNIDCVNNVGMTAKVFIDMLIAEVSTVCNISCITDSTTRTRKRSKKYDND